MGLDYLGSYNKFLVCYTPAIFIKLTRSGSHTYAQLVESFRDESGKPRQRTVATIGRIDESDGAVDSLLKGLLRARGKPTDLALMPQVEFDSALALGDVWALDQLWKELGFERLAHIKRLIVVADRGLVSLDNVDELRKVMLPNDQALEFIVAVPGHRYGEFAPILKDFQGGVADAKEEVVDEARWNELRLVIAHHPEQAQEQTKLHRQRIAAILAKANQWVGKLDSQDAGEVSRGTKLSDSDAKARLYHAVSDAHLARIIKVDLKTDLFSYTIDDAAQAQTELMDGKLLLVTNVPEHTPVEVVKRYKLLADIERGFRVLESEIEIAPVHHRLAQRIRAHAMLCFIALIVYRVMRQRLKLAKSDLSPEKALSQLRRIQRHSVSINAWAPITGISTVNDMQSKVFAALKTKKPSQDTQMNLL